MSQGDTDQLAEALLALRTMRARIDALERTKSEPIAIVGIGCRFPGGATDPERFWQLLRSGTDAITRVPADRWSAERFAAADPEAGGTIPAPYGGFLGDVRSFDPHFFGISPREAARDGSPAAARCWRSPGRRSRTRGRCPADWRGRAPGCSSASGSTTTAACRCPSKSGIHAASTPTRSRATRCASPRTGSRISCDLRGPSMAIDTACSSSLVAIHLACQSLRSGESTLAIAGGVNVMLSPVDQRRGRRRFLSPDGRCKAFDARANGYVRGEGAGIVSSSRCRGRWPTATGSTR